ncbi:MAG: DUF896 domain-containing protein [Lawsonibacter sp.]|nr:DUF896 domain-containing protein [Lawsonibacter sp.]
MEQANIDRINILAKKAKSPEGLTPRETEERDVLRREYIDAYRHSLTAQLDDIEIQYPDGTRKKLQKREPEPNEDTAGPPSPAANCPD